MIQDKRNNQLVESGPGNRVVLDKAEPVKPEKETGALESPEKEERILRHEEQAVEKPAIPVEREKPEAAEQVEEKAVTREGEGVGPEKAPPVSAPAPSPGAGLSDTDKAQEWVARLKRMSNEDQVKTLCHLAVKKNVDFAIKVAKALDSAYALDELHDSIVDELYQKLVEAGKLKAL